MNLVKIIDSKHLIGPFRRNIWAGRSANIPQEGKVIKVKGAHYKVVRIDWDFPPSGHDDVDIPEITLSVLPHPAPGDST